MVQHIPPRLSCPPTSIACSHDETCQSKAIVLSLRCPLLATVDTCCIQNLRCAPCINRPNRTYVVGFVAPS